MWRRQDMPDTSHTTDQNRPTWISNNSLVPNNIYSTSSLSYTSDPIEEDSSIVGILAACLERLLIVDDVDLAPSKFHSVRAPSISILQYLERIHQYANCSNSCLVVALIYIDRLCQQANIPLSNLTVHRILITAVCLAAKFYEDFFYPNLFYAQLGGIPLIELNSLEVEFLFGIDFALHVSSDVYAKYEDALFRSYAATRGGGRPVNYIPQFSDHSFDRGDERIAGTTINNSSFIDPSTTNNTIHHVQTSFPPPGLTR